MESTDPSWKRFSICFEFVQDYHNLSFDDNKLSSVYLHAAENFSQTDRNLLHHNHYLSIVFLGFTNVILEKVNATLQQIELLTRPYEREGLLKVILPQILAFERP